MNPAPEPAVATTRADIVRLIDAFYADVMADAQLAPMFAPFTGARWLSLWFKHTAAQIGAADAAELQATATGIAGNLNLGCFGSVPQFVREGGKVHRVPP